jgi:hypothetical protein
MFPFAFTIFSASKPLSAMSHWMFRPLSSMASILLLEGVSEGERRDGRERGRRGVNERKRGRRRW